MTRESLNKLFTDELNNLSHDIYPDRDLWVGIEHSINKPASTFQWKNMALVASIAICSVLISSVFFDINKAEPPSNIQELLTDLQNGHQKNKQQLLVNYTNQRPYFDNWESQMVELEQAEVLIQSALLEEPTNHTLLNMLRQIQNKQLELIDAAYAPRLTTI